MKISDKLGNAPRPTLAGACEAVPNAKAYSQYLLPSLLAIKTLLDLENECHVETS